MTGLLRLRPLRSAPSLPDAQTGLLRLQTVSVSYGVIKAVSAVDLEIDRGQTVAIIGANGAGKTTLAKAIMGGLPVAGGSVFFNGQQITGHKTYKIVRLGMTLVPEGRGVLPTLSVEENLKVASYSSRYGSTAALSPETIYARIPILGPLRARPAGQLSGGQLQLLAIGRALVGNPKLLILYEPSMGLSPQSVQVVIAVIQELKQSGSTMLLLEQNAQLAFALADVVHVLERGQIKISGTAAALRDNKEVRQSYLGVVVT